MTDAVILRQPLCSLHCVQNKTYPLLKSNYSTHMTQHDILKHILFGHHTHLPKLSPVNPFLILYIDFLLEFISDLFQHKPKYSNINLSHVICNQSVNKTSMLLSQLVSKLSDKTLFQLATNFLSSCWLNELQPHTVHTSLTA